jgi:mannose-6-phosphate isomerase-like protein (cupin superfamily)
MNNKALVFEDVKQMLNELGFVVSSMDDNRPWGGFFVIGEENAPAFIDHFFPMLQKEELLNGKLSPKILLVAPNKKLSWQYHHRRSEVWKLIRGEASIIRSETDKENPAVQMTIGELVELKKGERHRLVGLSDWGIVAEIWIHTDSQNPSDENDIVRLQDDFGR